MKKKKILIIVLLAVVALVGIYAYNNMSKGQNEYKTAEVIRGDIYKSFDENGEILSNEINTYYSDGMKKIKAIYIDAGDDVKEGDILLEYESTLNLEIDRIKQEIKALEYAYNEAASGVDFETVNGVKLQIEGLKSSLAIAKEEFEKTKKLFEEGIVTKTVYNASEQTVNQLENQISILNNQYNLLLKSVSINVRRQYEAQIESLAISLEILEKTKSNYMLKANFSGIITELNAFEGSIPLAGTLVMEIQDNLSKTVYADYLVDEAVLIKEGMKAIVKNDDIGLYLEELSVTKIHPKAVSKLSELGVNQKRVRVKIDLPKDFDNVALGANVEVEIMIEKKENVLLVPEEAIYEKSGKQFVTVLENGSLIEKEVVTGLEDDNYYEIISGLTEGEKVLLD
jgi:HlyD family secretion protein